VDKVRSIVFDELLEPEINAVLDYLDQEAVASGVENLYWLFIPRDLWSPAQVQAQADENWAEGEGYRTAIEVGPDWVRFELLVRSESLLNIGGGQADESQAMHILRWADEMARKLSLSSCCNCLS
jgi:hypothetical protein